MSSNNVTPLVPLAQRSLGQRIAATVRAEMARLDVSQAQVAAALGLSQQAVSLKIRGRRAITLDDLAAIAPLFDATATQLVADAEEGPRSRRSEGLSRPRRGSNPHPTGSTSAQVIRLDDYRISA